MLYQYDRPPIVSLFSYSDMSTEMLGDVCNIKADDTVPHPQK